MKRSAGLVVTLLLVGCKERPSPPPLPAVSASPATASNAASASASAEAGSGNSRPATLKIEELGINAQQFGCARYSDGSVACAGKNAFGNLGREIVPSLGNFNSSESPAPIAGGHLTKQLIVSRGGSGGCIVTRDGRVYCWGNDWVWPDAGAVAGAPIAMANLTDVTFFATGGISYCAIKKNGSVVCGGRLQNQKAEIVSGVAGAKQLAVRAKVACALTAARTVLCWENEWVARRDAKPVKGLSDVDEIAAALQETCVRRGDQVSCFGERSGAEPTAVTALAGSTQIDVNMFVACGLRADGTVVCVDWFAGGRVTEHAMNGRLLAVGTDGAVCVVTKDEKVACRSFAAKDAVEQL